MCEIKHIKLQRSACCCEPVWPMFNKNDSIIIICVCLCDNWQERTCCADVCFFLVCTKPEAQNQQHVLFAFPFLHSIAISIFFVSLFLSIFLQWFSTNIFFSINHARYLLSSTHLGNYGLSTRCSWKRVAMMSRIFPRIKQTKPSQSMHIKINLVIQSVRVKLMCKIINLNARHLWCQINTIDWLTKFMCDKKPTRWLVIVSVFLKFRSYENNIKRNSLVCAFDEAEQVKLKVNFQGYSTKLCDVTTSSFNKHFQSARFHIKNPQTKEKHVFFLSINLKQF